MSEFCKCGSIMINGSCTNKSCSNKSVNAAPPRKKTSSTRSITKTPVVKAERKSTKIPRASKCITYKLSDLPKEED